MATTDATPQLLKELQKFEEKKKQYMRTKDLELESNKKLEVIKKTPKNAIYYFRHPNLRLLMACTVIFLNFYIFAEDPISHSVMETKVAVIGNIYSFIFTNYPSNGLAALKVLLWMFSIVFGIVVGKMFVHHYLLCGKFKLKIFSKDGQGSWMIIFLFTLLCLYYDSFIYNAFLTLAGRDLKKYHTDDNMHIEYKTFNKACAIGTWFGDFFTAWMVLDVMLQEDDYPEWMVFLRRWWNKGYNRVIAFWIILVIMTILVVCFITTPIVNWDNMNNGMVSTNELSRSFLASMILVFDLVIIMQDWEFPHFGGAEAAKLPGLHSGGMGFELPSFISIHDREVLIQGKWFNYGILFIVMILDLNMWRSQISYDPFVYGQYTDHLGRIYTVTDKSFLAVANKTTLTYAHRWQTDRNNTNLTTLVPPPGAADHVTSSTFQYFNVRLKGVAFLPSLIGFFLFTYFVYTLGQEKSEQQLLVENWYNSKFMKKRRTRRVHPIIKPESDSDSDDDDIPLISSPKDNMFNYYFQHPYLRLLVAYTCVFLCCFLTSEDPIGHSHAQGSADILGNAYTLVFGSYPKKAEYATLKVAIWFCALLSGVLTGKYIIHQVLLNGVFKFKFFRKDQGSWMIMFIMFIVSLYVWTLVFNEIVKVTPGLKGYTITNIMQIKFETFIKGVAIMSFISHFVLALMVTDVILQEKHYPNWALVLRKSWQHDYLRITCLWTVGIGMTALAITAISIDLINWDTFSSVFAASNELGRSALAGFIIFFDVFIIMQDWEFPKFRLNPNVKLPGLPVSNFHFKLCCIEFELKGKSFTYGLLGLILVIDIYNLKNQLMYEPMKYEQFVDSNNFIVSIIDESLFMHGNASAYNPRIHKGRKIKRINAKYTHFTPDSRGGIASIPLVLAFLSIVGFAVKRTMEAGKK